MINLTTKKELKIQRKLLLETIGHKTPLSATIKEWDLIQLETLMTVDSLRDDETRKLATHKNRKRKNIALGAVIGGVIDASAGDDSIVDGILLGALFGAFSTSSPTNPKAQVALIFSDGAHLAVEVSKDEYTQLQVFAKANQGKNTEGCSSSTKERKLNASEVNMILNRRSVLSAGARSLMALTTTMISLLAFKYFTSEPEPTAVTVSSMFSSMFDYSGLFLPLMVSVAATAIAIVHIRLSASPSENKKRLLLRDEGEVEIYNSLNCKSNN